VRKPMIILLCIAMLFSTTYLAADTSNDVTGQPVSPKSNYITHAPIQITSNSDFASQAASNGWPGDGSQGNPYIIENYEIDGSGYGNCIWVGSTTCYFIIRNCYLHGASVWGPPSSLRSGIALYYVQNGKIENNNASNNRDAGIRLWEGDSKNIIVNNTAFSNNARGINIRSSNNNIVDNNTAAYQWTGILLQGNNNNVTNNILSSNYEEGIYLYSGNNNIIANNTASGTSGGNGYGILVSVRPDS
jgi:parallel beta-helix repeat protein